MRDSAKAVFLSHASKGPAFVGEAEDRLRPRQDNHGRSDPLNRA